MIMTDVDIAIVGGGCAGMSAALSAYGHGIRNIVIFERNSYLGGVLKQCIHNGFGIHKFREDLTGTQYAAKLIDDIVKTDICIKTDTIVLNITEEKEIVAVSSKEGITGYRAKSIILAMGCRERSRGELMIPGSRPAGVLTAGVAQRYMNIEGYLVGKKVFILGSGDIGLIMARQFVLEGAEVVAIAEVMPYSGGLARNIVQCAEDFGIPIYYNTTVTGIVGKKRVEGVFISDVDENRKPVLSTERFVDCDTLMLSVGLIPENEIAFKAGIKLSEKTGGPIVDDMLQTDIDGIFSCGNCLHVHDLVDFVSIESEVACKNSAMYILDKIKKDKKPLVIETNDGEGVSGTVPHRIDLNKGEEEVTLMFRPNSKFRSCTATARINDRIISSKKMPVAVPGEMCELKINKNDFGPFEKNDKLTVEIIP